jgi:hypothetical protein
MALVITTQMNLKGKGWKILPLINMLSEDQEPLYKVVPFLLGCKINKPTAFSSIIHLEPLILSREKKCYQFLAEGGK